MNETRKLAAIMVADAEQRARSTNQRNWEATCATTFELYWQLRYPFG
jgi:hypothetical protein